MRNAGTPHDALFKFVFRDREHAEGILRTALPDAVASAVDWTTLELCPGASVDEELSQRSTDLLFRAFVRGREARVLVLFEHQSQSDPWMPFRLLEYILRIWTDWRRDHPSAVALPAVIPVVLHHDERGWRGPTELLELVDLDDVTRNAWASYLPNVRFVLDDLPAQSDDAIRARAMTALGKLVLLSMKNLPYAQNPIEPIARLAPLMAAVFQAPNGLAALAAIVRYTLKVTDVVHRDVHTLLVTQIGKEAGDVAMSTWDRLIEQGRHQGLHQGRVEMLTKLLRVRFGELPQAVLERLQRTDVDALERWAERAMTAAALDDVFA